MNNMKLHLAHNLLALCFLLGTTCAHAWDGTVSGKISQLHTVPAAGNADTRVFLVGVPAICNAQGVADASWGYVNSTTPNYKGMLANLLTAYALNKTVTLFSTKSSIGYCEIGYMVMSD